MVNIKFSALETEGGASRRGKFYITRKILFGRFRSDHQNNNEVRQTVLFSFLNRIFFSISTLN